MINNKTRKMIVYNLAEHIWLVEECRKRGLFIYGNSDSDGMLIDMLVYNDEMMAQIIGQDIEENT